MKIGILQPGHIPPQMEDMGDYDAFFRRLLGGYGFDFVTYDVEAGDVPSDPHACDGWLITGSKHGAYEDHPWIAPLEALIRAIHAAGVPLIGVCFGHQIIAQALGGKVEKFAGGWSVGRKTYHIEGHDYPLNAWHQDQVVELPEGAEVVGSSDFCRYAALSYGGTIYTVQPHPEYDGTFIGRLMEERGKGVVPQPLMDEARTHLNEPVAQKALADRFAAVLKGEPA
ncbi:glutamine amidotransferase [Oceanicola sp. 22II-s10i]|uniref:type 1 glutamine amidotransferase n=1 Tax=Oceanicola sp. 22II-s10i TaxID=1317116 RepID=UPI000B525369|nr:type 1 glutamine amidotransferase [Oceanicola sp. 22II-s10i]OWU82357.1 glutamine amidotransferase [Oceanicola sp. 22II-s10i]